MHEVAWENCGTNTDEVGHDTKAKTRTQNESDVLVVKSVNEICLLLIGPTDETLFHSDNTNNYLL